MAAVRWWLIHEKASYIHICLKAGVHKVGSNPSNRHSRITLIVFIVLSIVIIVDLRACTLKITLFYLKYMSMIKKPALETS